MKSWLSLSGLPWRWSCAAAAVLALASPVYAVTAPEIRITPTTLYFGSATPSASTAGQTLESPAPASSRPVVPKELREKAASTGAARVIVQLAAPFSPEGRLAAGQALAQRQAIGNAQDAALEKLAGQKVKVHARYQHMPFLALEVDAAALDLLARLPEVTGIQEDRFREAAPRQQQRGDRLRRGVVQGAHGRRQSDRRAGHGGRQDPSIFLLGRPQQGGLGGLLLLEHPGGLLQLDESLPGWGGGVHRVRFGLELLGFDQLRLPARHARRGDRRRQ